MMMRAPTQKQSIKIEVKQSGKQYTAVLLRLHSTVGNHVLLNYNLYYSPHICLFARQMTVGAVCLLASLESPFSIQISYYYLSVAAAAKAVEIYRVELLLNLYFNLCFFSSQTSRLETKLEKIEKIVFRAVKQGDWNFSDQVAYFDKLVLENV